MLGLVDVRQYRFVVVSLLLPGFEPEVLIGRSCTFDEVRWDPGLGGLGFDGLPAVAAQAR
ncbi:hypothetical protein GCM10029976_066930 [Kribbella albertanoniae]